MRFLKGFAIVIGAVALVVIAVMLVIDHHGKTGPSIAASAPTPTTQIDVVATASEMETQAAITLQTAQAMQTANAPTQVPQIAPTLPSSSANSGNTSQVQPTAISNVNPHCSDDSWASSQIHTPITQHIASCQWKGAAGSVRCPQGWVCTLDLSDSGQGIVTWKGDGTTFNAKEGTYRYIDGMPPSNPFRDVCYAWRTDESYAQNHGYETSPGNTGCTPTSTSTSPSTTPPTQIRPSGCGTGGSGHALADGIPCAAGDLVVLRQVDITAQTVDVRAEQLSGDITIGPQGNNSKVDGWSGYPSLAQARREACGQAKQDLNSSQTGGWDAGYTVTLEGADVPSICP